MKINKKIVIAVTILIVTMLIVIISLGSVLAALNATTGGQFTIKYKAKNVKATITGQYYLNSPSNSPSTDLTPSSIVFNGTEQGDDAEKTFDSVTNIELDEDDVFYIKYTINNNSSELTNPYNIYLSSKTNILESNNLKVEYTYVFSVDNRISTEMYGNFAEDSAFDEWSTQLEWNSFYSSSVTEQIEIGYADDGTTELNFWIRISIKDPAVDAEITGGFEFELTSLRT